MQKYLFYILNLIAFGFFLVACSEELSVVSETKGDATVQFSVNVPAEGATTRAGTVNNQYQYETAVNQMVVLIFRSGKMVQAANGESMLGYTNRFKVSTRSGSEPVKFYLLANTSFSADALGKALYGKSPAEVREQLSDESASVNAHGLTAPFAFWGEFDMPAGLVPSTDAAPTQVTGVKMLRAAARAIVTKSVDDATFKVSSAAIYRMNGALRVIPASVNASMQVSAPTLPVIPTLLPPVSGLDASSLPLTYYLTESAAAASLDASVTGATCLVIGGRFGGSPVETYYRIDFEKDDNGDGAVDRVGEILRNHSYSFNITSVTAPGWGTPEEAANNRPSGLRVEVQDWEERHLEAYQNGQYNLSVTSREIVLAGAVGSENYLLIDTDVTPDATASNFNIRFEGSPVSTGNGGGTLENEKFKVTFAPVAGTSGRWQMTAVAKTENSASAAQEQKVVLKAENLTVTLTVRQTPATYLRAETNFMWLTSDGSNPMPNYIVTSSADWVVKSKPSWVDVVEKNGKRLVLKGQLNTGVGNPAIPGNDPGTRIGVVVIENVEGTARTEITVKQSRLVEWTRADIRGGTHISYNYAAAHTGIRYVPTTPAGTPLGLAAIAGDVYQVKARRVTDTTNPPNYAMRGDAYNHAQSVQACNDLVAAGKSDWRMPTIDEGFDLVMRMELTANKCRRIKNPDGTVNYFPFNGIAGSDPDMERFLTSGPFIGPHTLPFMSALGAAAGSVASTGNWGVANFNNLRCARTYY